MLIRGNGHSRPFPEILVRLRALDELAAVLGPGFVDRYVRADLPIPLAVRALKEVQEVSVEV